MVRIARRRLGAIAGILTTFMVYAGFVIETVERASRTNVAFGPAIFLGILVTPLFWLVAAPLFWIAFKSAQTL